MFLFDGNENSSKPYRHSSKPKRNKAKDAEAKAAAKAKKAQQDDMESLQITFYEIESWIEKTSPVLAKMTKELDRVSKHFDKGKKKKEETAASAPIDLSSMQWTLSFQPNNSMRLETNIKSVEQLIDALQKIKLVTESDTTPTKEETDDVDTTFSSSASLSSSSTAILDPPIEYWNQALWRRPGICLEQYKDCTLELSKLTEEVPPDMLSFVCQSYWDCLFPKFSADWSTFWDRSGDPQRNQVCIDSGLAMVFAHIIRHNKPACPNAQEISFYYYDRARQALLDYFESPDEATIEALLNLAMYCTLHKQYSTTRIYLELAYRMIVQLGYHRQSQLPTCRTMQKKYIKLFLVLYYHDMALSTYSAGSLLIDDDAHDIDFYQMLDDPMRSDEKSVIKDTFYVHLMELMKIHKRIQQMTREYQNQHLQHHYSGTLPPRWIKKIQTLEVALATWLDRVPVEYRMTREPTNETERMKQQSALLLMLHYQMQWIALHKAFLSPHHIPIKSESDTYSTHRSYAICSDAANRIVVMAEIVTENFNWCVCQLFLSCVYQASTIFCKSILTRDHKMKYSKGMIRRIISILAARRVNYGGFPDDLTACLSEFLEENESKEISDIQTLDQMLPDDYVQTVVYDDSYYNSPNMHVQCMNQQIK
ncbi:hypothetical protein G6F43_004635 [Rhizopus delemar]|nr:hypothetical protein G6F43_004635 [Rhizopus delemar]